MVTVSANTPKHAPRAVLVDSQQTSREPTQIEQCDPAMSVQAWHGRRPSHAPVSVSRRVVQMTPRCLARFQSFPDWYELPDSKSLACRIIGNAVPPLLMKKCISHWSRA
jgi:site-specific DNA-cytosine methylase